MTTFFATYSGGKAPRHSQEAFLLVFGLKGEVVSNYLNQLWGIMCVWWVIDPLRLLQAWRGTRVGSAFRIRSKGVISITLLQAHNVCWHHKLRNKDVFRNSLAGAQTSLEPTFKPDVGMPNAPNWETLSSGTR